MRRSSGQYAEFPNLCFVDTLDNVAGLGKCSGHQQEMFGGVSAENVARIKRQNQRKISVVIGNPPYNANQQNENDNNKNRTYPRIDQRIKATYIRESTAQKTKAYDMYTRFFRWASDRLKDDGIVAFVTNRSFIDSADDGWLPQDASRRNSAISAWSISAATCGPTRNCQARSTTFSASRPASRLLSREAPKDRRANAGSSIAATGDWRQRKRSFRFSRRAKLAQREDR